MWVVLNAPSRSSPVLVGVGGAGCTLGPCLEVAKLRMSAIKVRAARTMPSS